MSVGLEAVARLKLYHWALAWLCGTLLLGCSAELPPQKPAVRVLVQRVEQVPGVAQTVLTGDVQARFVSDLAFPSAGKVTQLLVDVGDKVVVGQLLGRLDPLDLRATLETSTAQVQALQARVELARGDYARQARLLPQGYTNRNEYERTEAALKGAEAELMTAIARRQVAKDAVADADLRALADGVVVARPVSAGEVVQAGQMVLSLAQDEAPEAVFDWYEALPSGLEEGTSIALSALSEPGREAVGQVREIAPSVSASSGTLRLRVSLPAESGPWPLGSVVVAHLRETLGSVVVLPWASLSRHQGKPAVWRLDAEQRVTLVDVEVLRYESGRVLVAAGLQDGDLVVAQGGQLLYPGQQVEVAGVLAVADVGEQP
ncbi:RND family efflux transporter, MFP subunit [Pseudomonas sp. 8Z]|uniref:efflux RND transporter periplasmic adaptor subunit n=1 Tax=Pseudomonas sp. 8Z TaxID=2653166 RepID=UPI0012F2C4DB|nr:efflux RND transporter periplasmic adaptor subunit [Pseudomonas sp. 8Z]VXC73105.1 RND family efflux transporter, MFP subunit [Pseudomonas sp. 8Z]